jgi:uncharacterized protein YutE (UPF0331/DUF86 family)
VLGLDVQNELQKLARDLGLQLLVAFGSSVTDKARPGDLDLAMLPAEGWLAGPAPERLWNDWARQLGRGDLDLVWLPSANWQVCRQIGLHGVPLFEAKPGVWRKFQIEAHLRSCASDPWRRLERAYLARFLQGDAQLDIDLVRRKAGMLRQYLGDLETTLGVGPEALRAGTMHYAAERLLELLVETAAWINTEVAQSVAGIPPSDYYSSFFSMERTGWIDNATAQTLAECARLRNALVHHYEDVSLDQLYARIDGSLASWRGYLQRVLGHL